MESAFCLPLGMLYLSRKGEKMKDRLYEKLEELNATNEYAFHMPGHKRKITGSAFDAAMKLDITEIEGFDYLHHPEDILKKEQEYASRLYGSKKTFFLINGSTCGVLAAICATTKDGDTMLMARNSHKSAYNAAYIKDLKVCYIHPQVSKEKPYIYGKISAKEVAMKMDETNAKVVFLTSPTYEGIVSNISEIGDEVHKRQGILIVDEAHGAHLGFHDDFPKSAVSEGADIVIQSMHKTLPCLTQTALLHICSERVCASKIAMQLSVFQTSSPSYVLMGSMSYCIHLLQEQGGELFEAYANRLQAFYKKTRQLKHLKILTEKNVKDLYQAQFDPSKINICVEGLKSTEGRPYGGKELAKDLLEKYQLQMEMVSEKYVLAMTSICDTQEGFDRLEKALFEIDEALYDMESKMEEDRENSYEKPISIKTEMSIKAAIEAEKECVKWIDCIGKISAEYIYLYPPGSPILTPGEVVSEEIWKKIEAYKDRGLNIQGTNDYQLDTLLIVKK